MSNNEQEAETHLSVAVIASSGGGTATLGHTDARGLLQCIDDQLRTIKAGISHALFVSLDDGKSLDSVRERIDTATLYRVDLSELDKAAVQSLTQLPTEIIAKGTLKEVNEICRKEQCQIAHAIQQGNVHGLICVSCHVDLFRNTLRAAAFRKLPVTGTGGTSLSMAVTLFGIQLVGNAGGSVATTSFTRAVSYASALGTAWNRRYEPWKRKFRYQRSPSWTSVINSCLPAFWGVCLAKAALRHIRPMVLSVESSSFSSHVLFAANIRQSIDSAILALENWVLPSACATIMATSIKDASASSSGQHAATADSSRIMASLIAAMTCSQSILSGLMAGWVVAHWTERILYFCILRNTPTTMTNMITSGGVGVLASVCMTLVAPFLRLLTQRIRWLILATITSLSPDPLLRATVGFIWGCISCYGCKVGGYHSLHLPLILVEMELGDPSFLGAVDELTLVLVCAGVCLGNMVATICHKNCLSSADAALSRRGLYINLACGDFIESCYPFMRRSGWINLAGYLGSGFSVAWLLFESTTADQVPKSLAYLPLAVSIALAGTLWERMAVASGIAVGFPFVFTMVHHAINACTNRPINDLKR